MVQNYIMLWQKWATFGYLARQEHIWYVQHNCHDIDFIYALMPLIEWLQRSIRGWRTCIH
jgi:hypothetical protein